MTIITDPLFYLAAIPAILVFGMSKGGVGGAAASLAVPVLALVIDPRTAAAIMLPLLLPMDATAVWKFRAHVSRRHLGILLPPSILGIAAAGLLMTAVSGDAMRVFLGAIALWFCAQYFIGLRNQNRPITVPGNMAGRVWGFVAGFTSTQIHAGGVPLSMYTYRQGLDKMTLTGTSAAFFAVVNVIKLLPYAMLGQFTATNLLTSLVLLPIAPLGVLLGHALIHRIPDQKYYPWLYFFLFLAALKLLWEGGGAYLLS